MPLIVTANLGRHVAAAEFLRNVRAVDVDAGAGAVVGWQEIDEADAPAEHHGLRTVFDDVAWAGWSTREPIALGSAWTLVSQHVEPAAAGLPRLSPARSITEAVAIHRPSGCEVTVLNLHYPRNDPRLLSRWHDVHDTHARRIRWHLSRGRTVIWTGDVNRGRLPRLHPAERTLAHRGLDWIRVVEAPAGTRVWLTGTGRIPLTIDGHDALWARVTLHPPSRRH